MPRRVVLVGPMGSGKSSIGRALARRLAVDHVDTDDLVVHRCGRTIPQIFATDGEACFRELESAALEGALSGEPSVVSTGGGIVSSLQSRRLLESSGALVVWLDASIDELVRRVGDGDGRPLLVGDVRDALAEKVHERAPLYDEVAHVRLDTSGLSTQRCVDAVVAALEREVTA